MVATLLSMDEFMEEIVRLKLKPATSAQHLCLTLANEAYYEHNAKRMVILISVELLPESYAKVPNMFAKSMQKECPYPSVQSTKVNGHIKVICANSKVPTTFRGKVLATLKLKGSCSYHAKQIPRSYRKRPDILANQLCQSTGRSIAIIAKTKKITWKFA